jgi:hypothetical protein
MLAKISFSGNASIPFVHSIETADSPFVSSPRPAALTHRDKKIESSDGPPNGTANAVSENSSSNKGVVSPGGLSAADAVWVGGVIGAIIIDLLAYVFAKRGVRRKALNE